MSSKPTLANAEIATNANIASGPQAGLSVKLDPGLATRQAGAVPGRSAPGRWWNYWFHQVYLWLQYLSDGAFTGAHSITNATAAAALSIDQTAPGGTAVSINQNNGSAAGLYINMPAAATVNGASIEGGIDIPSTGVTSPLGLRVMAQAPISLRDTEEYKYCDSAGAASSKSRTLMIPLLSGERTANWGYRPPDNTGGGAPDSPHELVVSSPATNDRVYFEPRLPSGVTVTQVRMGVHQEQTAATDMTMKVYSMAYDKDVSGGLVSTKTDEGSDVADDLGDDVLAVSLSLSIGAANALVIELAASNGGVGGDDHLYWVELTYNDFGYRGC